MFLFFFNNQINDSVYNSFDDSLKNDFIDNKTIYLYDKRLIILLYSLRQALYYFGITNEFASAFGIDEKLYDENEPISLFKNNVRKKNDIA